MPLYNFNCINDDCFYSVEYLLKLSDYINGGYSKTCPVCQSELIKEVNKLNFRLVGSRWERDGYHSQIDFEEKEALKEYDSHKKDEDKQFSKEANLSTI